MGPRLYIHWQDNNGRKATQLYYLPDGETVTQSMARANAISSVSQALSNARLTGGALVYDQVDGVGTATPEANVRRNLLCLLRNASNQGSLRIPSPAPVLPYDTSGPWQEIRITREAFLASGLIQPLEAALVHCVLPWGDPFPTEFIVAGTDYAL